MRSARIDPSGVIPDECDGHVAMVNGRLAPWEASDLVLGLREDHPAVIALRAEMRKDERRMAQMAREDGHPPRRDAEAP